MAGWIPPTQAMQQSRLDAERMHDFTVAAIQGLCAAGVPDAGTIAVKVARDAVDSLNNINRS